MNKPVKKTSFRRAVDFLKDQGVIKRDQDILQSLGITSKGTLSNYFKTGLPPHLQEKFQKKFGEHVAKFFVEEPMDSLGGSQLINNGNLGITIQEYLDSIREQKRMAEDHRKTAEKHSEDLKQIIIAQLTSIDQKLNGVGSNLNDALAGVFQQSLRMEAMGYTTLEALSVLTGKKPDALSKVSDKRQTEAALEHLKQGKKDVRNR